MSGKILPLPESVRSQLRSGVAITSVAQCVEELVLNSLDAGATCVAVRVDLSIFRIQVVDNGSGIRHGDLKVLGNRHTTSKCHTLQDLANNLTHYGFRGEALASIVDLAAIIDITTLCCSSTETYTKLFTYGKEKSVSPSPTPRPSVGTTVTVQDFMYNMPVRRKLIKEAIDIESIRMRLESFALVHPKVSFSLRNDVTNAKIFQASKSNCIISTFMQLFGSDRAQGLAEVYHAIDQFTISGHVSTQPHLTKSLQFVYINKRVILKTKIHKLLNELLARSSIISTRLHPATPVPGKTPSSPAKGLRLYGIFVINIECPLSEYDICIDPRKTLVEFKDWDKLLLCIEEMVLKFIQEENLVISLDERYRRSGRDQPVEEEDSSPVPHSSQALLQVFSLKRSGDTKDMKDAPKEKYGRTLCVQDNLSAVHSLPVRRSSKGMESKISYDESSQDLPPVNDDVDDDEDDDDDDEDFVNCKKAKGFSKKPPCTSSQSNSPSSKLQKFANGFPNVSRAERKDENIENKVAKHVSWSARNDGGKCENLSHVEYIKSIIAKDKKSNHIVNGEHSHCQNNRNSSDGDVDSGEENIIRSSLDTGNVPSVSDSSFEEDECNSRLCSRDGNLSSVQAVSFYQEGSIDSAKKVNSVEYHTGTRSEGAVPKKSSIEEFMEIFDAEMKKMDVQELCSTPEQDLKGTPSMPPPLKSLSRDCSSSAGYGGGMHGNVPSSIESDGTKKSLSKSLSAGMMKHQKKIKSLNNLQKFEFKKSSGNSHTGSSNGELQRKQSGGVPRKNLHSNSKSDSGKESTSNSKGMSRLANFSLSSKKVNFRYEEDPCMPERNGLEDVTVCEIQQGGCKSSETPNIEKNKAVDKSSESSLKTQSISNFHNFSKTQHSNNVDSSSSPNVCGLQLIETVAEVHRPPEMQIERNLESSEDNDSFRFEPVLAVDSDSNNCIETWESSESSISDQAKDIALHSDYTSSEQLTCSSTKQSGSSNEARKDDFEYQEILPDPETSLTKTQYLQEDKVGQLVQDNSQPDDNSVLNRDFHSHSKDIINREFEFTVGNTNERSPLVANISYLCGNQEEQHSAIQFLDKQTMALQDTFSNEIPSTHPFDVQDDVCWVKAHHSNFDSKSSESNFVSKRERFVPESQGFSPATTASLLWNDSEKKNVPVSGIDLCEDVVSKSNISISDTLREVESQRDCSDTRRDCDHLSDCDQCLSYSFNYDSYQGKSGNSVPTCFTRESTEANFKAAAKSELPSEFVRDCLGYSDSFCLKNIACLPTESGSSVSQPALLAHNSHCEAIENDFLDTQNLLVSTSTHTINNAVSLEMGNIVDVNSPSKMANNFMSSLSEHSSNMGSIISNSNVSKPIENPIAAPEEQTRSPSLHFSQLTLPDFADLQSSQSTELATTLDILEICTPVNTLSSFLDEGPGSVGKGTQIVENGSQEAVVTKAKENSTCSKHKDVSNEMDVDISSLPVSDDVKDGNSIDVLFSGSDSVMVEAVEAAMQLLENQNTRQCGVGDESYVNSHVGSTTHTQDTDTSTEDANAVKDPKESRINGWKESFDNNGRKIYVNLRTGNTSYDLPIAEILPEWTSSQPLGAPLLKIPLTHEPGYIPFGRDQSRQDFTLSHGFSAFLSWKKRREKEKTFDTRLVPSTEEKLTEYPKSDKSTVSHIDGSEDRCDNPVLSPMPQDTLDALLKDFEMNDMSVKWSNKPSFENDNGNVNVAQICQMWEAPNFAMDADVLQSDPRITTAEGASASKGGPVRMYNIVHPYKFSREMLSTCKVLGQLDNKFIACSIKHTLPNELNSPPTQLLVLFDQHAVHERVRLETIIEENHEEADSGKRVIRSSMVTPPLSLCLPDNEVRLMEAYSEIFVQRGLHFSKISTSKVSFHAIPNCLVAKDASELRHRRCQTASAIVESIVRDMCHTLHTTGGVVGNIPKPILYILNSQACRGAVKFGDELTLSQCQELITSLSSCQLPFQCAHGRPSIVPVVNLTHLTKLDRKDPKPNIRKLAAAIQDQEDE